MKAVPPPLPALSLSPSHTHTSHCAGIVYGPLLLLTIFMWTFFSLCSYLLHSVLPVYVSVSERRIFSMQICQVQLCSACAPCASSTYFLRGAFCCHIYLSNHQQQQMRQTSLATSISRICRHSVQFLLHYYLFLQLKFFVLPLSHSLIVCFFSRSKLLFMPA